MQFSTRKYVPGGICLILFLVMAVFGCRNNQPCRSCNDIVPGAIPQPNGTYACQWVHAERARAAQDSFVIYHYEWSADPTKLTPSGQEHLAKIANGLCQKPFPIVIEPSADRRLDELRKATVLETLVNGGCPVNPDRVIFSKPEAEGLYGLEAPAVARRMLSSQSSGMGMGSSAVGQGAFGGSQGNFGMSSGVGAGIGGGISY